MTAHQAVVETYLQGFREGDHDKILACLTDDVVWDIVGFRHLEGRAAFDGEIENPDFVGRPELRIDRTFEDGDTVVSVGNGEAVARLDGPFRFAFVDLFTFRGDLISRVESFLVPTPTT